MLRYLAVAFFAYGTAIHAQTVAVNTHIVAYSRPPGIHFQVSKYGQPPPFHEDPFSCVDCDTEITFQYENAKMKVVNILLDEGSDWFLVQPGDTFSAATVNAGQFPAITNIGPGPPPKGGEVAVGPGEFFLGIRTAYTVGDPGPLFNRTTYGWVHLRPVNGLLTMVENVMSYKSRGIIVGTTTVVPEPSVLASIGIAMALATVLRRGQMRRVTDDSTR